MVQTKRVTRSRAAVQRDSPRPRRKAAIRAAGASADPPATPTHAWTDASGNALVGSTINVWWPGDERYYEAMVLAYLPRRRMHKLLYLVDESIESIELGDGPGQRIFQRIAQPADPLIGKDIVFLSNDQEDLAEGPSWFDFMRAPQEKKEPKFTVKVYRRLEDEPDPEEVCSPSPKVEVPGLEDKFYRVIYVANEYLGTVNLSHVLYRVDGDLDEMEDSTIDLVTPVHPQPSALPMDTRRNGSQPVEDVLEPAAADMEENEDEGKDDAYIPPAEDLVDSDAEDEEEPDDPDDGINKAALRKPMVVDDADDEQVTKRKSTKEKPSPDAHVKEISTDVGSDNVKADGDNADDNGPLEGNTGDELLCKSTDRKQGSIVEKCDDDKAFSIEVIDAPKADDPKVVNPDVHMPDVDTVAIAAVDSELALAPLPSLEEDLAPIDPQMGSDKLGVAPEVPSVNEVTSKQVSLVPVIVKDRSVGGENGLGSKVVSVDRDPIILKDPHSGMDVDRPTTVVNLTPGESLHLSVLKGEEEPASVKEEATETKENMKPTSTGGSKARGEGSVGTQDTREDPLDRGRIPKGKTKTHVRPPVSAALRPSKGEDEEAPDTASDEEKVGWVSAEQKRESSRAAGSKSQVGDYISLAVRDGKDRRKAFVEAYLPGSDEHFVAFCDSEGGNLQLKLTSENHTVLKDEEVDELSRRSFAGDAAVGNGQAVKTRNKRRRGGSSLTLNDRPKKRREAKVPEVKSEAAGVEVCGRCLKIEWPGSDYVYTALVLGYNSKTGEHLVVYLSDHCVETVTLKYREWNLVAREDEPWIRQGMVGKRLYVFWNAEYTDDEKAQAKAVKLFGEETKVPYEAYVISYEGDGLYKVLYPSTEDTEVRQLKADDLEPDDVEDFNRDWDILEQGIDEIAGLPVVTWGE